MIARDVQRLEVVGVGLDLRTLGHREAESREDRDDLLAHAHERVHDAARRPAAGQREIGSLALALALALGGARGGEARVQLRLQLALGLVGGGADGRPLFGGQRAEALEDLRERTRAAEIADADRLELGGRGGSPDRGARLVGHGVDARVTHRRQRAWAFAVSVSLANAAGSLTASSASTLRSSSTPARFSAAMNRE
jgi:hypothetical protein